MKEWINMSLLAISWIGDIQTEAANLKTFDQRCSLLVLEGSEPTITWVVSGCPTPSQIV